MNTKYNCKATNPQKAQIHTHSMNNAKLTKGCFAGEIPETFDSPTRAVNKIEMINIVAIKDTKSRVSRLNLCDRLSMLYA